MKKVICCLSCCFLALLFIVPAFAEVNLDGMTVEELAALQKQLESAMNAATAEASAPPVSPVYTSASLLDAMIASGAPIRDILDYNPDTDPNGPGNMGSPGNYNSKTDFGCIGYAKNENGLVGGTLEGFPDEQSARTRYAYLESIYTSMPNMADKRMYLRGSFLLRVHTMVSAEMSNAIVKSFESLLQDKETTVFDPSILVLPDLTSAPTASVPSKTPEPTYTDLKKGSKGNDVARLQSRLKELGYLSGLADGDFGGQSEKAVKAFQTMNNLAVTGIATADDQRILFASGAVCSNGSIANEYDPYAVCAIQLSKVDLKSSYGYPYATFSAKNISSVTVKAFTYEIECYDAYGDRLSDYDESSYISTYSKSISQGKSVSVSTRDDYGIMSYDGVALVRVAVIRVLLEDGTDLVYDDPAWFEGN